jgi:hypothetical protein
VASDGLPGLEELAERHYAAGDFTRKGPTYLRSYSRLLDPRRLDPLSVLELGVSSGASLLCWRDYLPNATIVGIDVAEPPARILNVDRLHFVQGSQDDPLVLERAAKIVGGTFDLIVDDASHIGYLTKRSLHYLFPHWLKPGGWYVIEDYGTGFIPEYPDGKAFVPPEWADAVPGQQQFHSSQYGMVGVIKQLVEHLMQELMTGTRSYLAIERLIVETNIVFIEKSQQPGAAWPGYIPDAPASRPAGTTPSDERAVQDALEDHEKRLAEVERVVTRLRGALAPLLRLLRSLSRRD